MIKRFGTEKATHCPRRKNKMTHDIFENAILCRNCNKKMQKAEVSRNGYLLRAMICPHCNDRIIHPLDEENYGKFINLRNKEFNVKMRLVGNSYAVSIPKEIVSFMSNQRRMMNEMVKLCFEEMGKLSLNFQNGEKENPRIVKTREVKVVRNNKVFHARQFYDSAHPEKTQTKIYKSKE
ncbi:hypothetical protein HYT25_03320 [Candidatus Pacearchaeota archaeon]|nr:hypothetical protein [Candidatus Pacearchaeota archaeon]